MTHVRRSLTGAMLALVLGASSAMPHHAFSPVYDAEHTVMADGVVVEFRFINPHSMMTIQSQDAEGRPVTWTVEFDGSLNLTVGGWTADTIKAGERVTVYGNPTHTGSPRMFFRRLVRADGTELARSLDERFDAIDERRRQRRQQGSPAN